jgi:hypothetical protein
MPQPYEDADWADAQYNNRRRVPGCGEIFERWQRASSLARAVPRRFSTRFRDHHTDTEAAPRKPS